jgi:membrane-bound metal-dependent hydrolase YbcI (DUF457 family)
MANFRTHVTFSSMLGCGYTAAGYAMGVPLDSALVAGGMCGISGMLPDLDSDTGIPLRESMAFAAAVAPALLRERLEKLHITHDQMILIGAALYFLVRFGATKMIAHRTSHRGMFHSVPAALIFAGMAFLVAGGDNVNLRYFKAGGVFLGVMSHLLLDEIYSFEVKRGRLRVKKSFGTAIKFWSKDTYSNFSTYAKLCVVIVLIFSETAVLKQSGHPTPTLANTYQQLRDWWGRPPSAADPTPQQAPFNVTPGQWTGMTSPQKSEIRDTTPGASDSYGQSLQQAAEGAYRRTENAFRQGANYFQPPPTASSPASQPPSQNMLYDSARKIYRPFGQSPPNAQPR